MVRDEALALLGRVFEETGMELNDISIDHVVGAAGRDQPPLKVPMFGSPKFSLLGGGKKANRGRRSILILLTPRILG